jgi:hypothetical protein
MAEALVNNQLGALLTTNHLAIEPRYVGNTSIASYMSRLDPPLQHHLQKTAEGMTIGQIMTDWRRQGFESRACPGHVIYRQKLYTTFSARTPAQLTAIAAEAGSIDCPPLELTQPYEFSPFELTVLGLLRHGFTAKRLAEVLRLNRLNPYTGQLFTNLTKRLPSGEHVPREQSAPWLVHTARRLGLFAFTLDEAEHFPAIALDLRMFSLLNKELSFVPLLTHE